MPALVVDVSIGWLNRIESFALRSMPVALAAGWKRTTLGATTVSTSSVSGSRTSPSTVRTPDSDSLNLVSTGSRWRGVNVKLVPSWFQVVATSVPSMTGSARRPATTDAAVTGRENVMVKPVSIAIRSPRGRVASIRASVAARVRKAARTGFAIGRPVRASAPGSTVTAWRVSGRHASAGRIVSVRCPASQARSTSWAGRTRSDAATESSSIGVLKLTVSGSFSARPVVTTEVNAARVRGTGDDGGVAVIGAVPLVAIAPAPTTVARPMPIAIRAARGRRESSATWSRAIVGNAIAWAASFRNRGAAPGRLGAGQSTGWLRAWGGATCRKASTDRRDRANVRV